MLMEGMLLQSRYRIVRAVGGGGMGQVYLAHDTRLADKPCAVKEMRPDPHATEEERAQAAAQFSREAGILAHLDHPNLPNVYDYFEEGGCFYLVMDYIEGETLADRLARSPKGLPPETVVEWAMQLCDVLDYLHSRTPPVIFRDLKPSNVMITPEGEILLIDFGIARLFDPSKRTDTLKMGTAGYAPPEQYAGQGQTTPQSDIYSLGVTLHELLTGDDPTAHPFVFVPPHELNPRVPLSLSNVIMRALNLDPAERFPSARAMKAALQKAVQSGKARFPLFQRKRGTGTSMMPETAVASVPRRHTRVVRIVYGIVHWLGRLAFSLLFALLVTSLVLLLVAAGVASFVSRQAIVATDWGFDWIEPGLYTLTEADVRDALDAALELYALDAVQDIRIDFQPPDKAGLSLDLLSHHVRLQGRIGTHNGAPMLVLERMNGVPLYVLGGIISEGINRGFQEAWKESPLQVETLVVRETEIEIVMADW